MRPAPIVLVALIVACHSDSFVNGSYGAVGVLVPGAEERLTYAGGGANIPAYSVDGSLILYQFSPRYHQAGEHRIVNSQGQLVVADPNDTCVGALPAGGGSARWSFCETAAHHTDTTDNYVTASLNASNQLLYVEASSSGDLPIPIHMHADLWLANPAQPLVQRTRVRQLYHEIALGISGDDSSAVNWLTNLSWTDETSFIALGWSRWADGTLLPYGVVTGSTVQPGLVRIAGTETATSFTPAGIAGRVLFASGEDLSVYAVDAGGTRRVVATLPPLAGRVISGISCAGTRCVILSREPSPTGTRSTIWKVDPQTGAVVEVRSGVRASVAIALSPVSGDVVIGTGGNLYLLPGVAP